MRGIAGGGGGGGIRGVQANPHIFEARGLFAFALCVLAPWKAKGGRSSSGTYSNRLFSVPSKHTHAIS